VAVQVVGDGAVLDELVDQEELAALLGRAAVEHDQVRVAQPCQDGRLVHELLHAPVAVVVQPLHRHHSPVCQVPFVYGAKAAVTDLSVLIERIGGLLELLVAEPAAHVLDAAGLHVKAVPRTCRSPAGAAVLEEL